RTQLGHTLGLPRRFKLDLVDMHCRQHERGDDTDVEETDHRRVPLMTSANEGSGGRRSAVESVDGGASVRSAARSLAERARGLLAISASSAIAGREVRTRNIGAACVGSGRWRAEP